MLEFLGKNLKENFEGQFLRKILKKNLEGKI
jgi:hypothetical protein